MHFCDLIQRARQGPILEPMILKIWIFFFFGEYYGFVVVLFELFAYKT